MTRRLTCIVSIVAAIAATGHAGMARAEDPFQTRLEAAVVSKFPQFVEWPLASLAGRATVDLCVASPDRFGMDLEQLVSGETIAGRRVVVRRVDREQDVRDCQLLYVAAPASARRTLLHAAASRPILTVSDDPAFFTQGGIVRLRLVEGKLRFDIDAAAAQRVGLRISSQLLQLALTVRGGN